MKFRIDVGCRVEIACISHSVVCNPKAINKHLPGRKALDAAASYLANKRVACVDDPSLIIAWYSHVSSASSVNPSLETLLLPPE
jgi:hypothetical protein